LLISIIAMSSIQQPAQAARLLQDDDPVVRGARLYDDWGEVLGVALPDDTQPLWAQSDNTRSGPDTYRCVSCHGWDYQGAQGANRSGPNFTGFPGVFAARERDSAEIEAALTGAANPDHNFVPPLGDADVAALTAFIQQGVIDDNEFIDIVSRKVIDGDAANGQQLYDAECASCHGADGAALAMRFEGQDVTLGTIAVQEPWRFLHRTRFGVARAPEMPIGYELGWSPQDGRDVLLYAQGFPTGFEAAQPGQGIDESDNPVDERGGPAGNFITGLLTALGAMATSLGFAILLGAILVGVILLIVWIIRGKS
jgi:mono/diheme cytochrome c family protein